MYWEGLRKPKKYLIQDTQSQSDVRTVPNRKQKCYFRFGFDDDDDDNDNDNN
jgi:hypothetical protein